MPLALSSTVLRRLAVFALLAAAVACGEGNRQAPPLVPGPAPRHLAAVITVPSIDQARRDFSELLDGAGVDARVLDQPIPAWLGVKSLAGVDRAAPAFVVVVEAPKAEPATVLVVKVADRGQLQAARGATIRFHGDWAAIGPRPAVDAVAPWALFELISGPPPTRITVQLQPRTLVRAHEALRVSMDSLLEIDMELEDEQVWLALMKWAGAVVLARSSSATVTVAPTRDGISGEIILTPAPGSPFASLVQAQRPASFEQLSRLPAGSHGAVLAGRLTLGPLRADLFDLAAAWMADGTDVPIDLSPIGEFLDTTTGEFAAATDQTGDEALVLYGVSDPAAAAEAFARSDLASHDDSVVIGGTTFARWRSGDGDVLHGFVGTSGALTLGRDAAATAATLIAPDRAPLVSPAPPGHPGDMILFVTYEGGFTRTFVIGVAGGNLTVRWTIPPAAMKTALQQLLLAAP